MAVQNFVDKDSSGKGSDPEALPHSPHTSSAAGSDVDDNYNLYKQHEGDAPTDSAEARSVLRKIDWRVMPVLWTLYLLQYLDKNGLNYVCMLFRSPQIIVKEEKVDSALCYCRESTLCRRFLRSVADTFTSLLSRLVLTGCKRISVSRADNTAGSARSSTLDTSSRNSRRDGRCSDCPWANSLGSPASHGALF